MPKCNNLCSVKEHALPVRHEKLQQQPHAGLDAISHSALLHIQNAGFQGIIQTLEKLKIGESRGRVLGHLKKNLMVLSL